MVKTETLHLKNGELTASGLVPLNVEKKEFNMLMSLYQRAQIDILDKLGALQEYFNNKYNYEVINHISSRIKTPTSIINKMKKKNYELNYKNLIEYINDIAGIRVVCTFQDDVFRVRDIIRSMPNTRVIKEKDYITNPKKSGYMGYHMVIETMIHYEEDIIPIKVEIQIRTLAMDFWASAEHKMKYKTKAKLSNKDSKKLAWYAKIINKIDESMMRIYQKQMAK